jgi:hypothetical protein
LYAVNTKCNQSYACRFEQEENTLPGYWRYIMR